MNTGNRKNVANFTPLTGIAETGNHIKGVFVYKDNVMEITVPQIKLMAICSQCGRKEEVNEHVHKFTSAGKPYTCAECRRGGSQWSKESYQDYLKSGHWHIFRKKALRHYGRKCYICGTTEGEIHLHHNDYSRLGGELLSDVIPLCDEHHRLIHGIEL